MKFLGSARAAVLAVAVVTEVAGLGLAVLPAAAATRPGGDPDITITAGGDRTTGNSVSGTAGVRFTVPNANPNSCMTGANGTCAVGSPSGANRTVTQAGAPAGWFLSTQLGASPNSFTSAVVARDYSSVSTNVPPSGIDVPPSSSGTTTNPTARSGVWAVSRDNPVTPPHCGLNVALLFDLSFSVGGNLRQVQDAGIGYVNALAGTPSSVALYTLGTRAPVNSTNNSNFPLTPVTTAANVTALTNKIRGYTILNNPAQYTNWDAGMWQIASANGPLGGTRVHYDATIVISDGDPTVYGPTGIGQIGTGLTRFIDVENGIFSANALKAEGTKVIAVGINATSATTLNLRAISGPNEGSDYFITDFADLEAALHAIALANCSGTVNVTKLVLPANSSPSVADGVPAPGWTMHATGATATPATAVTNETGAVSFTTTGTREPVTVTEDVKSGYRHFPVGGDNAACTNLAGNPVPVTNAATGPGFTVEAIAGDIITCKVYNVQLAPSEVTTELSAVAGDIPIGGSASDTATLHGVTGTAGGTVAYRFYDSPPACETDLAAFPGTPPSGGTLVSTVTVTGGIAPPSALHSFGAAGTFYWAAFYSGDPSNQAAASDCATEPLVVNPAHSRVTTELSAAAGDIPILGLVSDSATLHGVTGTAGGTVAYRYYDSLAACDSRHGSVPRHPATRRHPGFHRHGHRRHSAALSPALLPRRGHLLLGRVLLRRPQQPGRRQRLRHRAPGRQPGAIAGDDGVVGRRRGDQRRRVGERFRDAARGDRHRGRDRGLPVLRVAVRLRRRRGGVPRHPATRRHAGIHRDGDRRRGAAVGRGHVRCRGHLLLGRVLLRRPQQPGGRQRLRRRAPGRQPGAIADHDAAVRRRRGDPGSAGRRATPRPCTA